MIAPPNSVACLAALAVLIFPGPTTAGPRLLEPISPIRAYAESEQPQQKIALGSQLFFDPGLSRSGEMSCGSCHQFGFGLSDGKPLSTDHDGNLRSRNTQGLFNIGLHEIIHWDGELISLEQQVLKSIPETLKAEWPSAVDYVQSVDGYVRQFDAIYDTGVTRNNIIDAIVEFERSLLTPDARFDSFLKGAEDVLTVQEKNGYRLFLDYGCVSCHQGVLVGGNMFATLGQFGDYFADRGDVTEADLGRFVLTGRESDRHRFKVPSLRNIEKTAPYLHDGTQATLEDVVEVMARYQLGVLLDDTDRDSLVAFLKTLTGKYRGKPL